MMKVGLKIEATNDGHAMPVFVKLDGAWAKIGDATYNASTGYAEVEVDTSTREGRAFVASACMSHVKGLSIDGECV